MALSKLSSLWDEYLEQLERNPVMTKAVTAAVTSVISDVLAQALQGRSITDLDLTSTRNQALIGFFIRGPFVHYWYLILEHLFAQAGFGSKKSAQSTPVVLAKVAVDQLTFSPLYNLFYFYVIGTMEGRSLDNIHDAIGRDFIPLMMTNYKVWPLVNILNFKYVPPQLRVLFGNIVSIFWMTYVITATTKK